jgi:hypothetical protein
MWANDLNLASANYDGRSYTPTSAANLEKALGNFESDLISTARLAGYYSRERESLIPEQRKQFGEIMRWLIQNIPESDYVAQVYWSEGSRSVHLEDLKGIWRKHIRDFPRNSVIALNAANWLSQHDKHLALEIVRNVIEYDKENIFAAALLRALVYEPNVIPVHLSFTDEDFEDYCDKRIHDFHASANEELAAICDAIRLYTYCLLDSMQLPTETVWSNEQALKMNPNDPILRCELIGECDRNHMRRVPLLASDPELARSKTHHILWLLENVPQADLYFFTGFHWTDGLPSHAKIVTKAIKKQRKVYGKTVAKYRPEYPRKKDKR